ncbi:autotransporter outer membrane beta-barrel domain-containing protein [Pseudomonas helleri]|nr:autotransporter outer membrane beta-barrel domain-containing protein [Pseudomonas helleri]
MKKKHFHKSPLQSSQLCMLGLVPLLLTSPMAVALVIDNREATINGTWAPDDYQLINAAKLTATGAQTHEISVTSQSELILAGSTVQAQGSAAGITVTNSKATITDSTVSSARTGLLINSSPGDIPKLVSVAQSSITGASTGAAVGLGLLDITSTSITATNADGFGLQVSNGQVTASDSRITGGANGVWVVPNNDLSQNGRLEFNNNTIVEGQSGAAILVEDFGLANTPIDVFVNSGSSLVGGNGVLLQVNGASTANMTVNNSQLEGDVVAEPTATAHLTLENSATLTGNLTHVSNLSLNSQGQWIMVGDNIGQVSNLSMNGGSVQFGKNDDFFKLSVASLQGSGTFIMDADFAQGKTDFFEVTGQASGSHSLLVSSSGQDPLVDTKLHVVHIGSGDAQFSLVNGRVDLGTYSYDLVQEGNDWYLGSTGTISPGTRSVLALFNTAPTVWYGELTSLRSRMGEIRLDQGSSGLWMRAYGNKFDVSESSGLAYTQNQQGISFGADAPLPVADGRWLAGVMGGYSKSDLDLAQGASGTVNSYYVGAYTTWIDESGFYFDGVLKFNRFKNKSSVSLSDGERTKGTYDNSGVGASLEFGRHIKLGNDYFVEPYTQLSGVIIQGKSYDLDNGLSVEGDRTRSLLGKLGATAGRDFNLGDGKVIQPYVRVAYVHEFAKSNEVIVNNDVFNNDLSGSRGELGAGIAMSVSDRLSLHADFDYSNGDKIEQPWGANVGLRYSW